MVRRLWVGCCCCVGSPAVCVQAIHRYIFELFLGCCASGLIHQLASVCGPRVVTACWQHCAGQLIPLLPAVCTAAWACATAGTSAKKGCAESSCNPVQANYGGMVLVLSTGSMQRPAPGECTTARRVVLRGRGRPKTVHPLCSVLLKSNPAAAPAPRCDAAPAGAEPLGHTPADCCTLCRTTDACNVWVFCNRKVLAGWWRHRPPQDCTSQLRSMTSAPCSPCCVSVATCRTAAAAPAPAPPTPPP